MPSAVRYVLALCAAGTITAAAVWHTPIYRDPAAIVARVAAIAAVLLSLVSLVPAVCEKGAMAAAMATFICSLASIVSVAVVLVRGSGDLSRSSLDQNLCLTALAATLAATSSLATESRLCAATRGAGLTAKLLRPRELTSSDTSASSSSDSSSVHNGNARASIGPLSMLCFWWVRPLISRGARLTFETIEPLWPSEEVAPCSAVSRRVWAATSSLFATFRELCGLRFVGMAAWRVLADAAQILQPLCLRAFLVEYVMKPEAPLVVGVIWGSALLLCTAVNTVCDSQMWLSGVRCAIRVRAAAYTLLYRKALTLSFAERQRVGSGEILTRMSVDARRVADVVPWIHCVWTNLLTIIATLALLWLEVRWAMVAGVIVLAVLVPLSLQLVRFSRRLDRKLMDQRDARTKLMSELLRGIKGVKASALEPVLAARVDAARARELRSLRLLQKCEVAQHFLFDALPPLVTGATFASFVLLPPELVCATAEEDGRCSMNPAIVFTTLSLLDMLSRCFMIMPHQIAALMDASVSFERVKTFLLSEDAPCVVERASKVEVMVAAHGSGAGGDATTAGVAPLVLPSHIAAAASERPMIEMCNASFTWPADGAATSKAAPLAISEASLCIARGELIAVVGSVGSGKSALLLAMLRELRQQGGTVTVNASETAYCSQDSILRTGSIRDNILLGAPFELERYRAVIEACALETDLRQLARADLTLVGERGITLSGGQRQRISLARAAYSTAPLVLLDDPLSAVDRSVAEHLHKRLLRGLLRGRTVVVATHALAFIGDYDRVVAMESEAAGTAAAAASDVESGGTLSGGAGRGGHIRCTGTASELRTRGITLEAAGLDARPSDEAPLSEEPPADDANPSTDASAAGTAPLLAPAAPIVFATHDDSEAHEEEEARETGAVGLNVFHHYLRDAGGAPVLAPLLLFLVATPAVRSLSDAWLAHWSDSFSVRDEKGGPNAATTAKEASTNGTSAWPGGTVDAPSSSSSDLLPLEVYVGLAVGTALCSLGVLWFSMLGGFLSARALHRRLLDAVLAARQVFFDVTPHGRVLNRFTSDQTKIDRPVPYAVRDTVRQVLNLGAKLVVQACVMRECSLLLVPVLFAYVRVGSFYRPCARELERLSSISLSPVYQRFAEALAAAPLVRALDRSEQHEARNAGVLRRAMASSFSRFVAERWLSFSMQMLGCAIIGSVVIFAIVERWLGDGASSDGGGGSAGFVGLALSYALSTAGGLNSLLNNLMRTEQNMVAVERNLEYCHLEAEAVRDGRKEETSESASGETLASDSHISSTASSGAAQWPTGGAIVFRDVVLRYNPKQPPSLRGVSFTIGSGERVGVVGRSGSGKSTLLTALLRLVELESGTISIDGMDIASLGLSTLRTNLAVIMQDACLFQGDMRSNLDPEAKHDDQTLCTVLQRVRLAADGLEATALLDATIGESGDNWSNGQRQLICCARALLKRARILLLDEATSSIDPLTDTALQEALRIECAAAATTTLTIAHRLDTIMDSDRVLVMDGGELGEYGPPDELAADPTSRFAALLAAKH